MHKFLDILKGRGYLEDQSIDGRIILKLNLSDICLEDVDWIRLACGWL
jgi:hypothetical protein